MKTSIYNSLVVFIFFICNSLTLIADDDFVKTTRKAWEVSAVNSLNVENKFGNITFVNNRVDSVIIDVRISINNVPSSKAENIFQNIEIEFENINGIVTAKTIFENKFKMNGDFSIDYIINVPANRNLNIKNKFGNLFLTDLNAIGNFEIEYGNIQANNLSAPKNSKITIDLSYGNAEINEINQFEAEINYSKIQCQKIENATIASKYSELTINYCNNLVADSKYDTYKVSKSLALKTDSKFSSWNIGQIGKSFIINNEYGSIKVQNVEKEFNLISIINRYGNFKISVDPEATYILKGKSSFCNIKYPESKPTKLIKEQFSTEVETVIGSGSNLSVITIDSQYGDVGLIK